MRLGIFYRVIILLGAVLYFTAPSSFASGEHSKRLAAHLVVLQGDLRQLIELNISATHQLSLKLRIQEKLGLLRLLIRYASQEISLKYLNIHEDLNGLQDLFKKGTLETLLVKINKLSKKYPLYLSPVLKSNLPPVYLKEAAKTHLKLCSGCHSGSLINNVLPAFDLFKQSRRMSRKEFIARIMLGLRGDQITSFQNPFTDSEISALTTYYQTSVIKKTN